MRKRVTFSVLCFWLGVFLLSLTAEADPLAVFEEREITGRDWNRAMVTYQLKGQEAEIRGQRSEGGRQKAEVRGQVAEDGGVIGLRGPAKPGAVRLVDEEGDAVPFQLWRVKTSDDGNIESARISFHTSLEAGEYYRYELLPGNPKSVEKGTDLEAERSEIALTLRNARVAIQLPTAGHFRFDSPLRMAHVRRHAELPKSPRGFKRKGLAFAPLRGIRLADGTWIGGSYFATEPIEAARARQNYFDGPVTQKHWNEALRTAPKVNGYTCKLTEKGPLFVEEVDYLRAVGDSGPQRWTRQIMFMKSDHADRAGYFVCRDSFNALDGDPATLQQKWWYQRTLGTEDQIQPTEDGFVYTSEWGPRMVVQSVQPGNVSVDSRDAGITMKLHSRRLAKGWQERNPGEGFSESITVNALGPVQAGRDIVVTIVPLKADQDVPEIKRLGDGVLRVDTPDGADYVFVDPGKVGFENGEMAFRGRAGAIRVRDGSVRFVMAEGGGTLRYKDYRLTTSRAVSKAVPIGEVEEGGGAHVPDDDLSITFALDPDDGPIETMEDGYRRQREKGVIRYSFDFDRPTKIEENGIRFHGQRGGIVVDVKADTVRVVMLKGRKIGYGEDVVQFGSGPYDLTFHDEKVEGMTEGPARRLHMTMPEGLNQLPAVNIDGVRYAPGTHGDQAIVPVGKGRYEFVLENLPQPPVLRNWVRW